MLDSGTTLTYFPRALFKWIVNMILKNLDERFGFVKADQILIV